MKIRVTLVVDVDPTEWGDNGHLQPDDTGRYSAAAVRDDVRTYLLTAAQGLPLIDDSDANVALA